MAEFYTHGMWHVKEGREEDFVDAWQAFANVGMEKGEGRGVRLIQDNDRKNVFYSFGAWDSIEAVQAFRNDPSFQEELGKMGDVLESFEVFTGKPRLQIGDVN